MNSPQIFFHLNIDGLTLVMLGLTNFLMPLILLTAHREHEQKGAAYFSLMLLMQVGLNGVFMAKDGFVFYVFWELTLIPIYFIALLWGGANRKAATMKFFAYTMFGSLFMLLAFIYLYLKSAELASFRIEDLYLLSLGYKEQLFVFLAFFLAFAIKIPIFPFHTWQPNTYTDSPTQGTMLLSGIMLKMGLYSLIRWLLPIAPMGTKVLLPIIMVLCVIGVIYASIIAIQQNHIKRLLAYSSIAHVGIISAGIFSLTYVGMQGAVVQMVAHGVNIVGLFLAADILIQRTKITDINSMGGVRSQAPKFATAFLIVLLASVALPLTNAFVGEYMMLYGIWQYNSYLGAVAGTSVILGAVYMFRLYQKSMLGDTNNIFTKNFEDLDVIELAVFSVIIFAVFVFGIKPDIITDLSAPVIKLIVELAQAK
jgi:NADH-quinone oxidoreductase subunit M